MAGPLDNRIPPPVMTVIIGIAMGAASRIVPPLQLPAGVRFGAVAVVMLMGGYFGGRAIFAFVKARTTINPVNIAAASSLVTSGVYGISRNPMYVGLAALLLALALLLSSGWLLLGPLIFIVFTTQFQIIPEERTLRAKFGAEYDVYCRRVRRWL